MHLCNALTRLTSHSDNSKAKIIPGLEISVYDIEVFTEMSALALAKIKRAMEADTDFKTLKQYINDGFPENKADCLESLRAYFNFREELAICDGLIIKGHCVLIPLTLHDEAIKTAAHISHGYCQNEEQNKNKFLLVKFESRYRKLFVHMSCLCNISGETTCRVSPE